MANITIQTPMAGPSDEGWLSTNLYSSITAGAAISFIAWVVRFVRYRQAYKDIAPSIPSPPFNVLLGTVGAMGKMYAKAPVTAHPHGIMTMMYRKYNLKDFFILDNWPLFDYRQIIIADPVLAAQCTQSHSLPKSASVEQYVGHITGKRSMLFTEGEEWKKNRALFNPGFSLAHLMTLVPAIVDEAVILRDVLGKIADSGEVHPIEEVAALATIDIMGHVVLDISLKSQTRQNELVESFRGSISWTPKIVATNPLVNLNPLRPIMQRYYKRKMNNYLEKVLETRFAGKGAQVTKHKRKPVIDLALDEYIQQQAEDNVDISARGLDKTFKEVAIDQMKTFIFAGHDTSSSTIAYAYHLLNQHPESLAKARDELDTVFGKDVSRTADMIKENPNIVNQLPYILSCIKETLRVFPPADTARQGDDLILNYNGKQYPTKGFMVMVSTHTIHRREDLFPRPDEFIPERFMPVPHNFQEIPKDAWRPFEKGPRACIGQELALLEMKIILALTLRELDIQADYETWDRKLGRAKPGDILDGRRGMFGERAFQELIASAKPHDGLPARVTRRTHN
ncbi:cytochrome P450 71B25 protein [Rutstroemia sp. NJR-2017a BBW]|nr:cytochrome P450 71B25 protein [Rutstroemia sp. NJR-2017a BBW]